MLRMAVRGKPCTMADSFTDFRSEFEVPLLEAFWISSAGQPQSARDDPEQIEKQQDAEAVVNNDRRAFRGELYMINVCPFARCPHGTPSVRWLLRDPESFMWATLSSGRK